MTTGFADIHGARLYYEVTGEGQSLVLVHAGICDLRMWDDQVAAFAEHYRVVRYDMRGYGQSKPVAGAFSPHEDLRALLDHLDIERAIVLGCSFGAMTALDFALTNPDRVSRLILVGTGLRGFDSQLDDMEDPPEWAEAEKAFDAGDYERASEMEVRIWVDGVGRSADQVDAAVRDKVRAMNLIALTNEAVQPAETLRIDPPAAQRLNDLRAPLLLIVGDLDQPDILEAADYLAATIDGAQKVVMEGTAHMPNMEQPDLFNRHVLGWLKPS